MAICTGFVGCSFADHRFLGTAVRIGLIVKSGLPNVGLACRTERAAKPLPQGSRSMFDPVAHFQRIEFPLRWTGAAKPTLSILLLSTAIAAQSPQSPWDAPASAALGSPMAAANSTTDESTRSNQPISQRFGPSLESFEPIRPSVSVSNSTTTAPTFASPTTTARPRRLPVAHAQLASRSPVSQSRASRSSGALPVASPHPQSQGISAATPPTVGGYYLGTHTAQSSLDQAERLFLQAEQEYRCGAYASAETSAWEVLRLAANAIDLQSDPGSSSAASQRFQIGYDAVMESQDFVGPYATGGSLAVARLARAHRTPVIRQTLPSIADAALSDPAQVAGALPSHNEAIDRYLDFARQNFSTLAAQSVTAARALDLIAAIRIGRNQSDQLPGPVAICLRRAAVQGQPSNPDLLAKLGLHLSDVGLLQEAHWALSASLTIREDRFIRTRWQQIGAVLNNAHQQQTKLPPSVLVASQLQAINPPQPPDVVSLPPEQFAAISPSLITGATANAGQMARTETAQPTPNHDPTNQQPELLEDQRISYRPSFLKKWW